jgi:hypothetical protein
MARELDAEVATKVMGWFADGQYWSEPDGTLTKDTLIWSPSTDIAAAWLVVERFRSDRWVVTLTAYHDGCSHWVAGKSHCEIRDYAERRDGSKWRHEYTADTMPMAICRAALAAVGGAP